EAGHQARLDRITHMRHDDGDRAGGVLCGKTRLRPGRDEDIDLAVDELGCERVEPIGLPLYPAVLNRNVLSLNIAMLVQSGAEGRKEQPGCVPKVAYPWHVAGRLRDGAEGHYEEAEGEHDNEPDGIAPHDHLLTPAPCRTSGACREFHLR